MNKLKKALTILSAAFVVVTAQAVTSFGWPTDYNATRSAANQTGKPVMLMVYRDGCPACESIISRISGDRFLQEQIKRFSYVALSVDEAAAIGFTATRTPTFFFLTKNGKEIVPPLAGAPKDDYEFLDYLTAIEIAAEKMAR